jgi:LacI family transcriptional regulator
VTIRDVAAKAAVSSMTVSRVINNDGAVSPATRERVEAVIRELNYAPNPAAQRLAAAKAVKIALLYDNPSAGFLSEFLLGALEGASRNASQLLVLKHEEGQPAAALVEAILGAGVDGVVLPPPLSETEETLEHLTSAGVAAVAVAPGWPSALMSTVRIDNERAARDIADHLLALGHQRFGFIAGHPNQSVSEQRRWGFVDQLGRAGVPPSHIAAEQGYFTYKSGLAAAEKLLESPRRPSAIFAANDDMAAATLSVAHRMGLDVPRDLSVVGFDDTLMAGEISPALTTVRQPVMGMATAAVALLTDELKRRRLGPVEFTQVLQDHALVVRESTGPAR